MPIIKLDPKENPAKVKPLSNYNVSCTATGVPLPNVYWIIETINKSIPGSLLQLKDLRKDTIVTCYAENNVGKVQQTLAINILGIVFYMLLNFFKFFLRSWNTSKQNFFNSIDKFRVW